MEEGKRARNWESWIDEQIREAQERGEFDDLLGKGKPLDLTSNPHALDRELAFKLLKDAGHAPDWIELDKAIRARIEATRAALTRSWEWREDRRRELADRTDAWGEVERARSAASWQETLARFAAELDEINLEISELNLKVPGPRFQRRRLAVDRELERIAGDGS